MGKDVHSSTMYNSSKPEIIQMSISSETDKLWYIHRMVLHSNESKCHTQCHDEPSKIMLRKRMEIQKYIFWVILFIWHSRRRGGAGVGNYGVRNQDSGFLWGVTRRKHGGDSTWMGPWLALRLLSRRPSFPGEVEKTSILLVLSDRGSHRQSWLEVWEESQTH